jgi:hypothetical protein
MRQAEREIEKKEQKNIWSNNDRFFQNWSDTTDLGSLENTKNNKCPKDTLYYGYYIQTSKNQR